MQNRTSFSSNRTDTSISRSKQFDSAIPASRISALSSGEFVGMVADDPDQKLDLKLFHAEIINDHAAFKKEQESYQEIPVFRKIDQEIVQHNYHQIKAEIRDFVDYEMQRIATDPAMGNLIVRKGRG